MDFFYFIRSSQSSWAYLALVGALALGVGALTLYGENYGTEYGTEDTKIAALKFVGKGAKAKKKVPDFSFVPTVLTPKIAVGGEVSFGMQTAFRNGFNSTKTDLWVKGLPEGVSGAFMPNPLPHQGAAVFTLQGDGSEVPGTYRLTLGASAEGMSRSQEITLLISRDPDFAMNVSPATQAVPKGKSATYEVSARAINGFSEAIALSSLKAPKDFSVFFTPNPLKPGSSSLLTVQTSAQTGNGEYSFEIKGSSGDLARNVKVNIHVTSPGSAWIISSIGRIDSRINTIRVGSARNDGVVRVYAGTIESGRIFEFSWEDSKWSNALDIGGSPQGQEIHNMTIGAGRNDGILRIYAGSVDDNLYELTYDGSKWTQETVGASHGDALHAAIGDGRNDGVNRLYAVRGTEVFEYTWNGQNWDEAAIGKVSRGVAHGMALGNGRNDGQNYIYVASTGSGVYEGVFQDGAWSLKNMGDTGDVRNVGIGEGRGDGKNHVYGALLPGGRIREFTRSGNTWAFKDLTSHIGEKLVHAYVLSGRGDETNRVYTSGSNGNAYEFSWNGKTWDRYTLGGGVGYMYGFHYGNGRNDGIMRLYGGSFNARIYEYTWSIQ